MLRIGLLLLGVIVSVAVAFTPQLHSGKIVGPPLLVLLHAKQGPRIDEKACGAAEQYHLLPERSRRRRILAKVKGLLFRLLPTKKQLVCLAIAIMIFFRGPSAFMGKSGIDPNVAHAGVNVKVSGVRVQATVKADHALLESMLPRREKAAGRSNPGPTKQSSVGEKNNEMKKQSTKISARAENNKDAPMAAAKTGGPKTGSKEIGTGTTVIAAATSGIVIAKVAHETKNVGKGGSPTLDEIIKREARQRKAEEIIRSMLEEDEEERSSNDNRPEVETDAGDLSGKNELPSIMPNAVTGLHQPGPKSTAFEEPTDNVEEPTSSMIDTIAGNIQTTQSDVIDNSNKKSAEPTGKPNAVVGGSQQVPKSNTVNKQPLESAEEPLSKPDATGSPDAPTGENKQGAKNNAIDTSPDKTDQSSSNPGAITTNKQQVPENDAVDISSDKSKESPSKLATLNAENQQEPKEKTVETQPTIKTPKATLESFTPKLPPPYPPNNPNAGENAGENSVNR